MYTLVNLLLFLNLFQHPAATSPTAAPAIQHSRDFKIKSHALAGETSPFSCLYLEPYHIGAGYDYAVLSPPSAQDTGVVGHLNGTANELANDDGNLIFDFGNGITYGFVIDSVNATYNPILITAGDGGTEGIFIDQGIIKYHNPISGGFYACNKTLLYGSAVQLFYKPKVITTPEGCGDVELVVKYVD